MTFTKKELDAIAMNLDALSDYSTKKLQESLSYKELIYIQKKSIEYKLKKLDPETIMDLAEKLL